MVTKKSQSKDDVTDLIQLQSAQLWEDIKAGFQSRAFREFASGALSGGLSKTFVAPLETVRTRLIVGVGPPTINGNLKDVLRAQGWRGLWVGNGINAFRTAPCQAVELCTFETTKRALTCLQERWAVEGPPQIRFVGERINIPVNWISVPAVSGAVAGVVSTLSCYPLEVLKDRFTVQTGAFQSIWHACHTIVRQEGAGALYRGLAPTLIGLVPYSAAYYALYDCLNITYRSTIDKTSLAPWETLIIGALAGLGSSVATFPLEVARKRLMVGRVGRVPARGKPNMVTVLRSILQDEGVRGWYRGVGASCLKVMPSSGLSWMFYEGCKDVLHAQ